MYRGRMHGRYKITVAGFMLLALAAAVAWLFGYCNSAQLQAWLAGLQDGAEAPGPAQVQLGKNSLPPDLRRMAWEVYDNTYIVRPHLDKDYQVMICLCGAAANRLWLCKLTRPGFMCKEQPCRSILWLVFLVVRYFPIVQPAKWWP